MERTQQPLSVGQKKNKTQAQAKQSAVPTAPHKDQRSKRSKKPQPQSAQAPAQAGMTQPRTHTGLQPMPAQQAAAPAMASTPVAQQPRMTMSKTKKTVKKAAANHILVVAHPSAQAQQVFDLLKAAGVQEALPSRREQLSAQALTETLLKAYGLQWSNGQVPISIESVEASPMWQSLVLDLVLGNMEQPLWAWLDPQAVHLLDFWQQQSAHTVFMLVYDDIQNIYQQCLQEGEDASPEAINAKVQTWVAYNEALLQFHLRNPERSFLVHAKQVTHSAQSYLQQLNQRIASPVQLQPSLTSYAADSVDVTEVESNPAVMHQIASAEKHTDATASASVDTLTNWLMDQLVQMQTDALELYEQLQATANLPLARMHSYQQLAPHAAAKPLKLHQAWSSLVAMHKDYKQSLEQVQILEQTASALQNELNFSQQKNADAQAHHKKLEEENHLALEQLHRVQEELERFYLQKVKLQQDLEAAQRQAKQLVDAQNEVKKTKNALQAAKSQIQQLEGVQAELKRKNEALQTAQKQKTATPKELQEENELLLRQLHQVQEELERYYLENKKLKAGGATYKVESSRKSSGASHYGAAERIKNQLSYRLGSIMIEKSRSLGGWFAMPFALRAETQRFRQESAARKGKKLPPIESYVDAFEAERVKQHLSYRLGATMIQHSVSLSGWFSMPWALYAQVKEFRQSRR